MKPIWREDLFEKSAQDSPLLWPLDVNRRTFGWAHTKARSAKEQFSYPYEPEKVWDTSTPQGFQVLKDSVDSYRKELNDSRPSGPIDYIPNMPTGVKIYNNTYGKLRRALGNLFK